MFFKKKNDSNSYLSKLNKAQLEAVTHTDGPVLVLACAGSGKTTAMVSKLVYLIKEKEISPENILMLTFTNRAAQEMKKRAEKELGENITGLFAGTFHSFCARLLRIHAEKIGYGRDFTIMDQNDVIDVIDMIKKKSTLKKTVSSRLIKISSNIFHTHLIMT